MDAFSYLSVLISIILGLALTQLLTAVGRLVRLRDRVAFYWPAAIWMGVLFVMIVQGWWTMFTLRLEPLWTIDRFFVVLLHPTFLYLLVELIVPESDGENVVDMRSNYFRQAPAFFGALLALLAASLVRPIIIDGHFAEALDVAFHVVFAAAALTAATWRRETYHRFLAPTVAATIVVYVGLLFVALK